MDWLAISAPLVTSAEWLRIHPALRGHWVSLAGMCAIRENAGVIANCRGWSNRDWDRTAGVTRGVLAKLEAENLVRWDGDDLMLAHYDVDGEARARRTRTQRRAAADARWAKTRGEEPREPQGSSGNSDPEAAPAAGFPEPTTPELQQSGDAGAHAPPDAAALHGRTYVRTDERSMSGPKLPTRAWKGADYLRSRILEAQPNNRLSKRPWFGTEDGLRRKWANELRLMVERDGRSYEEVGQVIKWLFEGQTSDRQFVVLSMGALREKWDRIEAVRGRARTSSSDPQPDYEDL